MADPIIVDDGGSTRIKWAKQGIMGEMDTLMNVTGKLTQKPDEEKKVWAGAPGSKHTVKDSEGWSKVLIVCQDKMGMPQKREVFFSKNVLITSNFNQNVFVEKAGAESKDLDITLFGIVEPMVESRQHESKRRYIVSNSGPIQRVTVDDGKVVYDVEEDVPDGAQKPILYTSVVFT